MYSLFIDTLENGHPGVAGAGFFIFPPNPWIKEPSTPLNPRRRIADKYIESI
jgi:hypothetical protein